MKITDTKIKTLGVFRCCLDSIDNYIENVEIGDKFECPACSRIFTLQITEAGPAWVPDDDSD